MFTLKQSTAETISIFVHDVNGDAVLGLTNASFTKRILKQGGAWANLTATITEGENGWYSVPLSTNHTNTVGVTAMTFISAGAKQVNLELRIEANLIDDISTQISNVTAPITKTTWSWRTQTSATDPGVGSVKADNSNLTLVTNLYINELSISDFNSSTQFSDLEIGDTILLQIQSVGSNFITLTLSADVIDNGAWFTLPVTVVETAGLFSNNDVLFLNLSYAGVVTRLDSAAGINTEARLAQLNQGNMPDDVKLRMLETSINTTAGAVDRVTLTDVAGNMRGTDNANTTSPDNAGIADIQGRIPAALVSGRIESNVSAINASSQAALNLRSSTEEIIAGTCIGVPSVTVIPTDLAVAVNSLKDGLIIFKTGAAINERKRILTNTVNTLTILAVQNAPAAGDTFVIV